jgi:hypothetical protein
MRVRVFLDFDGVLNPEVKPPSGPLTDWCESVVDGVSVMWSPTVAGRVAALAARSEVLWLTTWGQDAQVHLAKLMQLPRFELAGTDKGDAPWRWWKHDVVTAFWDNDPRPFVWIDDDLTLFDEASDWMGSLPPEQALAIAPNPEVGLTPNHLDTIDRFVTSYEHTSRTQSA